MTQDVKIEIIEKTLLTAQGMELEWERGDPNKQGSE